MQGNIALKNRNLVVIVLSFEQQEISGIKKAWESKIERISRI